MDNTRLLTEREAACVLSVAAITLRNWHRQGKGPVCVKFGRSIRYAPESLRDYITEHLSYSL